MSEAKVLISYMVARTTLTSETVEVCETSMSLLEANTAKIMVFQRPDTAMCWVERLEQKRIGEIMDKRKRSDGVANAG